MWNIFAGPDTDAIPFSHRRADDHCHFNYDGNILHAQAWLNALRAYLDTHSAAPTRPAVCEPTVTLTANGQQSLALANGAGFTLTYSSSNASSCALTWSNAGVQQPTNPISPNTSGSIQGAMTGNTLVYTLSCIGVNGQQATQTAAVQAMPSCAISVNPTTIPNGGIATLTWTMQYANNISIAGLGNAGDPGSTTVSPSVTSTYYATVAGPTGKEVALHS